MVVEITHVYVNIKQGGQVAVSMEYKEGYSRVPLDEPLVDQQMKMKTKVTVEIKYAAYVTTEVEGELSYVDEEVWPPEAVLESGERIVLEVSDNLGPSFVESIDLSYPEEAQ